jgi:hypothetical protein
LAIGSPACEAPRVATTAAHPTSRQAFSVIAGNPGVAMIRPPWQAANGDAWTAAPSRRNRDRFVQK